MESPLPLPLMIWDYEPPLVIARAHFLLVLVPLLPGAFMNLDSRAFPYGLSTLPYGLPYGLKVQNSPVFIERLRVYCSSPLSDP